MVMQAITGSPSFKDIHFVVVVHHEEDSSESMVIGRNVIDSVKSAQYVGPEHVSVMKALVVVCGKTAKLFSIRVLKLLHGVVVESDCCRH